MTGPSVDGHCPYCALQCATTLTPRTVTAPPPVTEQPTATGAGGAGAARPAGPARPGAGHAPPAPAPPTRATSDDAVLASRRRSPVTVGARDFPTNRGGLCAKGWTAAEVLSAPDRLVTPLVRGADGELAPTTWEAALDLVADRLTASRAEHGPDSVAVFGGGGLTNEKAYQLGRFARVALGTSRIDYNGRFCMSSAAAAGVRAFGLDRGLPFPVEDLGAASTILLLGSNPAATMPPLLRHLAGARVAGGLIVVDPRRSQTARLTEDGAGEHLQPAPGTDLVLLLGLLHVVFAEGLVDEDYVAARTTGVDELRRSVAAWWPERVQSTTGVPAAQLRRVARRLADGRGTYVVTGRGVEQQVDGTDTATAAVDLALVLGLVGRRGSGYGTLTGQGNGQGGREHGQKCDQLPGYRRLADPAARRHVAGVWGVDPDSLPGPGVPAVELLGELGRPGGVRCLLVHGSNVVVSAPDVTAVRAGLAALDLLVVCDVVPSETAALADVVLPVTQWAEEEGTTTSLEGRVLRRRRVVDPPGDARDELWVLAELARRLDAPATWSTDAAEVFDELARASAGGPADYSGLSHALLDTGVVAHWPYPAGSSGTPRLFEDRFAHPDGRARLVAVVPRDVAADDPAPVDGRVTLVTGRLLEHYQSGAQTRRVPELVAAQPVARLEVHPATAARLGLEEGCAVEVSSPRGTVGAVARVTADVRHDTVFLPFHHPDDECANLLTSSDVDPVSAMPGFKRTPVTVRRVDGPEVRRG